MLSAVIIAKNEAQTISRAIQSVLFCDEVLVIDNASEDRTARISKKYGARVVHSDIRSDFSELRDLGMKHAMHEWVLFLDADEVISDTLRVEIKHELEAPTFHSYYLRRRDHFLGKALTHGEVATVYERGIIRLLKKGSGLWNGMIHELFYTEKPVGALNGFIDHYPHQRISEFVSTVNKYSSVRAAELLKEGKSTSVLQLLTLPSVKFIYTYLIKSGYRDGMPGFIYSFMMSFHSFLVRAKMITNTKVQ